MSLEERHRAVLDAFVRLASADDPEPTEAYQTLVEVCVPLLGWAGACVLLAEEGSVHLVAAFSTHSEIVGLLQVHTGQGPCVDAVQSGERVWADGGAPVQERWPRLAAELVLRGCRGVGAVPIRQHDRVVGAMSLCSDRRPTDTELLVAEALAAVTAARVGTVAELVEASRLARQLQGALDGRVLIEQAKGVLAERHDIVPADAFNLLRDRARTAQIRVADLAAEIVAHQVDVDEAVRRVQPHHAGSERPPRRRGR